MAFEAHLEMDGQVAKIFLKGQLDANAAPEFRDEVEKAAGNNPTRLALMLHDLEYIASAGIRVLIFAKQKMGGGVDVVAVSPQEQIVETLEMTGLTHSIEIIETLD
ncbi:MAG: anti-anti-sigma factor [Ectothiorhodospiraceae bacterium]|nr:anti-anti-sigma factor [Ectothiorhodospiraceae bacterium]